MKPAAQITFAERAGRALGQMWRAGTRLERKAYAWLVARGLAKGALWAVKLAVLAILLYAAFWVALLLVFAVVAAWVARNGGLDEDDQEPEWRMGLSGYGLYRGDTRIDPGGPDDDY
ncbi:MAG TPA: DUF3742 family protein [Planctomycetota bacterium]|nr:DUF3742 family protein [Planctomycetota bacterium]